MTLYSKKEIEEKSTFIFIKKIDFISSFRALLMYIDRKFFKKKKNQIISLISAIKK